MKNNFTIKISKVFIASLLLCSLNAFAVDYSELQAYEIEVVIFKFKNTQSAGSEIWPDLVTTESIENVIELHNSSSLTQIPGPDEKAYYYSKIPAENYRLTNEVEKLTKSNEYEIIYHSAWIQPGLDKENAEFIHLNSIEKQSELTDIDSFIPGSNPLNNNQPAAMMMAGNSSTQDNDPVLDGVVKVELGRYLHIYFDLKYQRDLAPVQGVMDSNTAETYKELKYYPVQTHRRMRSKEIHYIDHPLIGILVLATPFELPDAEEEQDHGDQPLLKLQDMPINN